MEVGNDGRTETTTVVGWRNVGGDLGTGWWEGMVHPIPAVTFRKLENWVLEVQLKGWIVCQKDGRSIDDLIKAWQNGISKVWSEVRAVIPKNGPSLKGRQVKGQ
ncbi:hypothetical protein HAX54_007369 [Datura stramonium]|uniref:Uncharacterized protein n=1 Tax=Datura stramonium TaxID=4076 RepID=A0ABS8TBN3_DATST|nr:hypothetical protein [Datura stramonium]